MKIAVVPGSFDPMTVGHIEIIERASRLFDKVFVAVMVNDAKKYMFDMKQRFEIATLSCKDFSNVEVVFDNGLLADLALRLDACAIVKGLRDENDYEYEKDMAKYNYDKNPNAQTIFLPCTEELKDISSTLIRKKLALGEDISALVSKNAVEYIKKYACPDFS